MIRRFELDSAGPRALSIWAFIVTFFLCVALLLTMSFNQLHPSKTGAHSLGAPNAQLHTYGEGTLKSGSGSNREHSIYETNSEGISDGEDGDLPLPAVYSHHREDTEYCNDHFSTKYLREMTTNKAAYCEPGSSSSLTCFYHKEKDGGRIDNFCYGENVQYNSSDTKFDLDCELRTFSQSEQALGILPLSSFKTYWYDTGPRVIFNHMIRTGSREMTVSEPASTSRRPIKIFIRREAPHHLWHDLMEIEAMYFTLDVFRMTRNPATNSSYFSEADFENTQVVVVDEKDDGPFWELWGLFAKQPMIRFHELDEADEGTYDIIVPLPGASNPTWEGDWVSRDCENSELMQAFSRRVLQHFNISSDERPLDSPLQLTYIDRNGQRKLINKLAYLDAVRSEHPTLEVRVVDFADHTFEQQLKIIHETDILVGVHGAGLTHGIFLPRGSAMVEIEPEQLHFMGFRNVAKLMGHGYFGAHAQQRPVDGAEKEWHVDDVWLEKSRFMELVDAAVKSMYNRGVLNEDVVR